MTVTKADREAMALYYRHRLIMNPTLANDVLADNWEAGCSDCERAMLDTFAAHRLATIEQCAKVSEQFLCRSCGVWFHPKDGHDNCINGRPSWDQPSRDIGFAIRALTEGGDNE